MKIIECIVRPSKVAAIQRSLSGYGVRGMTLTNVLGCGSQKGITEFYRGYSITNDFFIKTKIELLVADEVVHYLVEVINTIANTGEPGDGKVFISNIENAVRIRSFECGNMVI
ncbi:nitrogen regulatory protein PII [Desulfosporosinus orientis DSM 765]|uniref:Nitrogen regulatory protein PII n=1 Tax=Desulfosporosinus orientis (strain ATCC 19365 / DSM 765 / NCIMB 8382 / VKM B-1628 / Singapore I) TaxID=768706 RepID=G7WJN1_DESOD|nr:P-II family nitrogen regulator [Desulfosporosinus orientis]AET70468.1 nitrogen regulatory protein PII [Desulfosporosinus orientis DSM 765]